MIQMRTLKERKRTMRLERKRTQCPTLKNRHKELKGTKKGKMGQSSRINYYAVDTLRVNQL